MILNKRGKTSNQNNRIVDAPLCVLETCTFSPQIYATSSLTILNPINITRHGLSLSRASPNHTHLLPVQEYHAHLYFLTSTYMFGILPHHRFETKMLKSCSSWIPKSLRIHNIYLKTSHFSFADLSVKVFADTLCRFQLKAVNNLHNYYKFTHLFS